MEGGKLEFTSRPSIVRGDKTVPRWAVVGERNFRDEGRAGHGRKPVFSDWQRGASGLLLHFFEYVDKLGDTGILCPPKMHGEEHGDNVGTFKTTPVSGK